MDRRMGCQGWRVGLRRSTMHIALAMLGAGLGACNGEDHRMDMDEFLRQQAETEAVAMRPLPEDEQATVAALMDQQFGPFVVGPGDVLSVTVTGQAPEPLVPATQVRVSRNGEIFLPFVGAVQVGGKELEDVEVAVRNAFVPTIVKDASDAAVFVDLVREGPTEVLVTGAVQEPGLMALRRSERNVLHAIVQAGGVSDLASGRATLRRLRHPEKEIEVDLTHPAGVQAALALPPLERGDIIDVEAAMPNTYFVGGLVPLSRPQVYPPGVRITVLQAIAAAGGLRTDITPREATLIRRLPDGGDAHVKLDLDAIRTGEEENLLLAAGDVLWVPHTLETRVQDFINRNFFLRAGVSVNYNVSGVEFLNRQDTQAGGRAGDTLQDQFDPFGFLNRNQSLSSLADRPVNLD